VVVKFNGKRVDSMNQMLNLVAQTPPDTTVTVTVIRDGKEVELKATVVERPPEEEVARGQVPAPDLEKRLGLTVTDLTDRMAQQLRVPKTVNRQPVPDVASFRQALSQVDETKPVALLVKTRGLSRFVSLKLR
jgi:S1-C subfamily serine protease